MIMIVAKPTLGKITRQRGIAGQMAYTVEVTYPDEPMSTVTFVGQIGESVSPVVMVTPGNPGGTFVTDPSRFGEFGIDWVRKFFG